MNKDVILAVADAIEREELLASKIKFNMLHYSRVEGCGTAACIAGWAFAIFNADGTRREQPLTAVKLAERDGGLSVPDHAARAMGLLDEDGDVDGNMIERLFAPDWLAQITPADATQTLRTLAATGDVVWNDEELEQRALDAEMAEEMADGQA